MNQKKIGMIVVKLNLILSVMHLIRAIVLCIVDM